MLSVMEKKSCTATGEEMKDRLSLLPDDVLLSIMNFLSTKEAARASLVSHKWNHLWRCIRTLIFEDLTALDRIHPDLDPESSSFLQWINLLRYVSHKCKQDVKLLQKERPRFVSWVDHVVGKHVGLVIDEFSIKYDLDVSWQSHVDKWVVFALDKQVKRLELDFTPFIRYGRKDDHEFYELSQVPLNFTSVNLSLTSLCLRYVDITAQAVACFLQSCPLLEHLCIERSKPLTTIRSPSGSALSLKHLEVYHCQNMKRIDISAPDLLSLKYLGCPIELHVRDASSLSVVSVGGFDRYLSMTRTLDSISLYSSQLECLTLWMGLNELNLEISNVPSLTNLKHLEFCVYAKGDQSLLGWVPLMAASPGLQKLTIKFWCFGSYYKKSNCENGKGARGATSEPVDCLKKYIQSHGSPLKCLKTLELVGFLGHPIDLEIASYVFQHAIVLEKVVVDVKPPFIDVRHEDCLRHLVVLKENVPPGVKIIFKPLSHSGLISRFPYPQRLLASRRVKKRRLLKPLRGEPPASKEHQVSH